MTEVTIEEKAGKTENEHIEQAADGLMLRRPKCDAQPLDGYHGKDAPAVRHHREGIASSGHQQDTADTRSSGAGAEQEQSGERGPCDHDELYARAGPVDHNAEPGEQVAASRCDRPGLTRDRGHDPSDRLQ